MNLNNMLLRQWLPAERRSTDDRRADERRHLMQAVEFERRADQRRSGIDRREDPAGHLRNALQVLHEVRLRITDLENSRDLSTVIRRLTLALLDLERHRQH
jgi:hypothetical protein